MKIEAVIFDMDGLLVDSEPLWQEAADELLNNYGLKLTPKQYATTTGLRTIEFLDWWFNYYNLNKNELPAAEKQIIAIVMRKFAQEGKVMPGVQHILQYWLGKGVKLGLASSSPMELIDLVVDKLGIRQHLHAIASAGNLPYGKPHPQVYLNCASQLGVAPIHCLCFEDSFNGMIAAKAARMRVVVVPAAPHFQEEKWHAADLKLSSLQNFNDLLAARLQQ